jgi:hypothetical protein
MDDVDNLGQVRKVAIVVVALFLVHGSNDRKGFIRGKQSNQRKYTDTLPRQFTMDYSLALLSITTVWNRSDKYSSIIRSGGLRTRPLLQEHSPIYLLLLWCLRKASIS